MPSDDIQQVAKIIRDVAAREVVPYWGRTDSLEKASGGGLQTPADVKCEAALSEALKKLYPDAVIVGEEGVSSDAGLMRNLKTNGPVFVIDPIDGTRAFAAGRPEYSVMVSLHVKGKPVASWIYFPATDDFYMAKVGEGITREHKGRSTRLRGPATTDNPKEMTGINGVRSIMDEGNQVTARIKNRLKDFKNSAWAAGYDFASLLRGENHIIMWGQAKFNDVMPWQAFLTELGYSMSTLNGDDYDPSKPKEGIIVAPTAALVKQLSALYLGRPLPAGPIPSFPGEKLG
jgi:fructose-1,6-bisphosphatase/inositol monophosphatase family enzyme